jgi:lipid-A-disaccharide synthase
VLRARLRRELVHRVIEIALVASEASGDRLGALVATELQRASGVRLWGAAGPQMRTAGVEPVVRAEALGTLGLAEAVPALPRIALALRALERALRQHPPDVLLTIDGPTLHLRLAARWRRLGIPVAHLVCPQVWAWRRGRIPRVARSVDMLLCLLPFEPALFQGTGLDARFVGHPGAAMSTAVPDPNLIALVAGSRAGEVRRHWPLLRQAAALLRARHAQLRFVVPRAPTVPRSALTGLDALHVKGLSGATQAAAALVTSGTASLELAAAGVPQVVFYKVHPATWSIGRRLVQVDHVALPNLLAGRTVVPELLQEAARPATMAAEVEALLAGGGAVQRAALRPLLAQLQASGAAKRMADCILELAKRAKA